MTGCDAQRRRAGGRAKQDRGRRQRGCVGGVQAERGARQRHQADVEAQEDTPVELAAVGGALRAPPVQSDLELMTKGRKAKASPGVGRGPLSAPRRVH